VHGLLDRKSFGVGPVQREPAQAGHLIPYDRCLEHDVFGTRQRLEAPDQIGQRKADPRDDTRPGLDATESIDTFFERVRLQNVFERKGAGALGGTGDFD
jgi:hypothetical protein